MQFTGIQKSVCREGQWDIIEYYSVLRNGICKSKYFTMCRNKGQMTPPPFSFKNKMEIFGKILTIGKITKN